jgi:ribose-phosphate pyrophosphokinase
MTSDDASIKLFAGTDSDDFVDKMCAHLKIKKGMGYAKKYPEGNTFVKIEEKVRGKNVYLVKSIAVAPNDDFMELLFWIDAFKRASVKSVTAIIPYFSYAKGDKKDEPRVSIRARVCADCLEEIGIDRILTMDLHSPQIQGFFKKPVDHLSAIRRRGQVARQGSAKPSSWVQIPSSPLAFTRMNLKGRLHPCLNWNQAATIRWQFC